MSSNISNAINNLQLHVTNDLQSDAPISSVFAGIIGDQPSKYAKSPSLWRASFNDLKIDASYLAFDVTLEKLHALIDALRRESTYLGGNVTVPHKIAVMELLDDIDPLAKQIGAVNTIVHQQNGRLVGYNTDANGLIASLLQPTQWQQEPFMNSLLRKKILLIGAGGAAKAAAFATANEIGPEGRLYITNRSIESAESLTKGVNSIYGNAVFMPEDSISDVLPELDLVINSSTKGQSGLRHLAGSKATCLELYSSLAPASPAVLDESSYSSESELYAALAGASAADIEQNIAFSNLAILRAGQNTQFFDMIYSPLETPMLKQARLSGHAALNGKGMNILQAVDSFVNKVMANHFKNTGWDKEEASADVTQSMAAVW